MSAEYPYGFAVSMSAGTLGESSMFSVSDYDTYVNYWFYGFFSAFPQTSNSMSICQRAFAGLVDGREMKSIFVFFSNSLLCFLKDWKDLFPLKQIFLILGYCPSKWLKSFVFSFVIAVSRLPQRSQVSKESHRAI